MEGCSMCLVLDEESSNRVQTHAINHQQKCGEITAARFVGGEGQQRGHHPTKASDTARKTKQCREHPRVAACKRTVAPSGPQCSKKIKWTRFQGRQNKVPRNACNTLTTSMGCTNIQADIPLAPAIPKLRAVGIPLEVLVDIVEEGCAMIGNALNAN